MDVDSRLFQRGFDSSSRPFVQRVHSHLGRFKVADPGILRCFSARRACKDWLYELMPLTRRFLLDVLFFLAPCCELCVLWDAFLLITVVKSGYSPPFWNDRPLSFLSRPQDRLSSDEFFILLFLGLFFAPFCLNSGERCAWKSKETSSFWNIQKQPACESGKLYFVLYIPKKPNAGSSF